MPCGQESAAACKKKTRKTLGHVMRGNCAVAAVFDGCGGIGSRKYPRFMDHTGAYMASRAASGALHDWFHETDGGSGARSGARKLLVR